MKNKVWYVTGASKGLGLSLVKKLLAEGYDVAATSRNVAELEKAVGKHKAFLPLAVDLVDEDSVMKSIADTVNRFGSIDIVVNNSIVFGAPAYGSYFIQAPAQDHCTRPAN